MLAELGHDNKILVMVPPYILQQIRFAVREATAFVGHSFADQDEKVVDQIQRFLSKLGVKCDSGKRPEPKGISEKIKERIHAAELFVGIFTRDQRQADGSFSTSAWTIDEKATALAAGKRLLLFVESGVRNFGGLQGDYEYISFERDNLAEALIHAMDYVLAITSVPLTCRMEGPDKLHFHISTKMSLPQRIEDLKKIVASNPRNIQARLEFAELIADRRDRSTAVAELRKLATEFPNSPQVHHTLAHKLDDVGDLPGALLSFQRALDLNSGDYRNYRCYGKCLYRHALTPTDTVIKRSSLEKARRLIERAAIIGGQAKQQEIQGDLFVIDEALKEVPSESPPGANQ
ncbi:MAG: tetratricopeptide repeat protein [Chthoniobacterales bacterium]